MCRQDRRTVKETYRQTEKYKRERDIDKILDQPLFTRWKQICTTKFLFQIKGRGKITHKGDVKGENEKIQKMQLEAIHSAT
mgnify:CR=1 FL=1